MRAFLVGFNDRQELPARAMDRRKPIHLEEFIPPLSGQVPTASNIYSLYTYIRAGLSGCFYLITYLTSLNPQHG